MSCMFCVLFIHLSIEYIQELAVPWLVFINGKYCLWIITDSLPSQDVGHKVHKLIQVNESCDWCQFSDCQSISSISRLKKARLLWPERTYQLSPKTQCLALWFVVINLRKDSVSLYFTYSSPVALVNLWFAFPFVKKWSVYVYNLHAIELTHLKYTIQWFLEYLPSCATITII